MILSKVLKRILLFITVLVIILIFPGTLYSSYTNFASIESPVYTINSTDNILHGIGLSTTDVTLKDNLSHPASYLFIKNSDGSTFSGGCLPSGMSMTLYNGNTPEEMLKIDVFEDPSGNGTLKISDFTIAKLQMLGFKTLAGEYKTAVDINGDGIVSISDYNTMHLDILGFIKIVPYDCDLPLAGCVIGIDPGHQAHPNYDHELISPYDTATKAKVSAGTYGRFTGVREYVINLQVALKLKINLEELGATVILTRESHEVNISNSERAVIMNSVPADCWIRIHANGSTDPGKEGMFFLIPSPGTMYTDDPSIQIESSRLASCLLPSALSSTGAVDLGITQRSDQTGFCWSSIPVCTIEMGHMTNEKEDNLLVSDEYQKKIAKGLADGFLEYFK